MTSRVFFVAFIAADGCSRTYLIMFFTFFYKAS
jgi:hypothetical protein